MKAVQIKEYSQNIDPQINEIAKPKIEDNQILVKAVSAAVNPLDIMDIKGEVKLMQSYKMPLTLGNELSGVVEEVGTQVSNFKVGDKVYTRLPIPHIGAFAQYVAVDARAVAKMPQNLDFKMAAAAALTGLTAYQGLNDILHAQPGQTLFIPGGSGSFGQMAIPIAKSMGLYVIVSGSPRAKEQTLAAGADEFLDYKTQNYWEELSPVDYVIDAIGMSEFEHELSVIKPGGTLLSLKAMPNYQFAKANQLPWYKKLIFGLAGHKLDKLAKQHQVNYRFIFVKSSGEQLQKITEIIEKNNIQPAVDPTIFSLNDAKQALELVANGHPKGKVEFQIN